MPYIIATNTYPSHKQNEVIKKYLELIPKYPTDESTGEVVAQPVAFTNKGFKVLSIWEVKEGKFEEAFRRINTYFYEFKDIEGYEADIRVLSTFPEAISIAGIPSPE
ncbi:hypothetical protein LCGC14_2866450 [marine sediment metagenome]|uniref:ABM domain-containing protein n=1 Tax=marine sediment metagenome TaxID=412755 RepID=A0A0F8XY20_9ZZZZ|nr:MAG: hypothetical protein Lokiarch_17990 [Candidatus Lokiarchaeum sp. GC14_75]